jgi:hypothetical protein
MKDLLYPIGMSALFLLGATSLSIMLTLLPLPSLLEGFVLILAGGWICALRNRNKKSS